MKIHNDLAMRPIEQLIPYVRNSRTHSDDQVAQVAASIREFGFTNPVLIDEQGGIIAGHGRVLAARKLGMTDIPCLTLKGLTDVQRRAYVIADNRLAEFAGWDQELLALELEDLRLEDFNIDLIGFDATALEQMFEVEGSETKNFDKYSVKTATPIYEPNGTKPEVGELYDNTKALELISQINDSDIPEEEKAFLIAASQRHVVFNYAKIADFWAHSSAECQSLMEKNALVIIDFDKAIENGFVKASKSLDSLIEYADNHRNE